MAFLSWMFKKLFKAPDFFKKHFDKISTLNFEAFNIIGNGESVNRLVWASVSPWWLFEN